MQLLTKDIEKALTEASKKERATNETPIIVKYFTPDAGATWFITEGVKLDDGDWRFFGFCDLGDREMSEVGYVLLSQLQKVRGPFGLAVERDLHYPPTTLADVLAEYGKNWF